ncbi:PEPxxWA-CTERM sorting domain-containing protein [Phenylobacterium sp.]|uniref:PEPxxWA-CTERM sorting domain-containing protein n=1 Tax=Phenylobacterium sp. TaxID=1871053 RepID=UPI0025D9E35B|nr:PEPxxWA-CTERM sorting domain-containing protein [Phenylobacterium sp.]MBX3483050.1 PEPxxWA-CTERM sorting domain-containing protein [Phenylobacterium sp.]MCW5761258.1 PEPxxWA-CTERM sorting domain-containing protein [Phenylobacterium sp.]
MRTLKILTAAAAAFALAGAATSAFADPVTESQWAATGDNGGLGGTFAYLNSNGQDPFENGGAWDTQFSYGNVVFNATFGETSYTNYDSWNGSDYIYSFGDPDTTSYGQTFFAPGGALTSFNFLIYNYSSGGGGGCGEVCAASAGPVDANFVIAAFDGSRPVGPVLYTTSTVIPVGDTFAWTNIGDFNVQLQQGQQYIAFLTTANIDSTGGVPEPATWALMIGGFGLAGAGLRRRRAAAA